MKTEKQISRRDFLKGSASVALMGSLFGAAGMQAFAETEAVAEGVPMAKEVKKYGDVMKSIIGKGRTATRARSAVRLHT